MVMLEVTILLVCMHIDIITIIKTQQHFIECCFSKVRKNWDIAADHTTASSLGSVKWSPEIFYGVCSKLYKGCLD